MESEKARGLKPGTIYSKLVYYSSVLSWAVSQGWLKENPLRKVKFPRSDPHRTRIPTEEEYQRLCAAAHWKDTEPPVNSYQRTVAAFRFSMLTGMRKGEIVKIERSWIDGSVIHLPAEAAKTAVGRTVAMGQKPPTAGVDSEPWLFPLRLGYQYADTSRGVYQAETTRGHPCDNGQRWARASG